MSIRNSLPLAAALCLAAWPMQAADGVLIVEKTTRGTATQTHQIQIEKDRMRAETTSPAGEKQAFVFDGAKQTMWIVNYDRKTFSEMEDQGFSGVPVRRMSFGSSPTTTELTDVTRQTFPDSTFAVPSGFKKESSPFGGRGRGQQ